MGGGWEERGGSDVVIADEWGKELQPGSCVRDAKLHVHLIYTYIYMYVCVLCVYLYICIYLYMDVLHFPVLFLSLKSDQEVYLFILFCFFFLNKCLSRLL